MDTPTLTLQILTPEGTAFDGPATAVFLPGVKGRFEVLNMHAPLISSLCEGDIRWRTPQNEMAIHIKSGVARVTDNTITVCAQPGQ